MSLSGDKGVAQFKKSVKMGHPNVQKDLYSFDAQNPPNRCLTFETLVRQRGV